jgi:hypothetical protein
VTNTRPAWLVPVGATVAVLISVVVLIAAELAWTRPVRAAVRTYSELIAAGNLNDLARARALCSSRYLETHSLRLADEGGLEGLPRNIHTNFQAWREGPNVWLCPTNRVGPIYQFVPEAGDWKFDGPVGLLQARGEIVRMPEVLDLPHPPEDRPHDGAGSQASQSGRGARPD